MTNEFLKSIKSEILKAFKEQNLKLFWVLSNDKNIKFKISITHNKIKTLHVWIINVHPRGKNILRRIMSVLEPFCEKHKIFINVHDVIEDRFAGFWEKRGYKLILKNKNNNDFVNVFNRA